MGETFVELELIWRFRKIAEEVHDIKTGFDPEWYKKTMKELEEMK